MKSRIHMKMLPVPLRVSSVCLPDQPVNLSATLAIILISDLMIVLDSSIVLTGLSKIQRDLSFPAIDLAWVQSAYTFTFGGLLLSARASDLLSRRRVFLAGLALFTLASLTVGFASSSVLQVL